jgi:integrase
METGMAERKGFIVEKAGKLYVRVCYTDQLGQRRELMRRAKDRKHARELKKQLVKQLENSAEGNQRAELDGQRMTFRQLAERYEAVKLIPAQYVGDRKVAGLRSFETPKRQLRQLVAHFGNARIRSITHSQVDDYRLKRLSEKLKISSANRELALLRSIFNFGKREGFISRTPFEMGAPLISAADETKRDRVLSRNEEERLLLALSDERRLHIRALTVAALDTGARKNELLTLRWSDLNIEGCVITLRALNTKTARARQVPISSRLKDELQRIGEVSEPDSNDALVFSNRNFKWLWLAALSEAGVADFRFHDLRHTFASRLAHSGLSISELAALLGHTQIQTTLRYANPTAETIQKATGILNALNAGDSDKAEGEAGSDYVN